MDIINLIVGLFMIGMGFLVKSSPDLISGYNTMSKEKKKNIDIEGLSTYMRNGSIAIGLSVVIGYYLFKWLGFTIVANLMIVIVILVGVTILVINAQKFDHNKTKKSKLTYFILGFSFIFVIGLITSGLIPSKITYNDDTIRFSGQYGFELNTSDIESVELLDEIPTIKVRTNGFSLGIVNKGFFNLNKFGKARLLIHSDKAPFMMISKKNGEKIIINFGGKVETEQVFETIKTLINK